MPADINLPDKVTPEQFAKAEPLVLTLILQDEDSGFREGIIPLTEDDFKQNRVRSVKPGEYVGEFRSKKDPKKRFSFKLSWEEGKPYILYSPINPELFKSEDNK